MQETDELARTRQPVVRALLGQGGEPDGALEHRSTPSVQRQAAAAQLREAIAVAYEIPLAELTDQAVTEIVREIERNAAESATRFGDYVDSLVEHLQSIGCTEPEEVAPYFLAAGDVLERLYRAASQPQPSPTELMRLALQYALDARHPVGVDLDRCVVRQEDSGWEIVVYPSVAVRAAAIPLRGRPVRDPLAVSLLDCLQQRPPQLYRLRELIERWLEHLPGKPEPSAQSPAGSQPKLLDVDLAASEITVEGKTHSVDQPQAEFLKAVMDAAGQWIAGPTIAARYPLVGSRPDRVLKKLPDAVHRYIESEPGKGYRLRTEQLA